MKKNMKNIIMLCGVTLAGCSEAGAKDDPGEETMHFVAATCDDLTEVLSHGTDSETRSGVFAEGEEVWGGSCISTGEYDSWADCRGLVVLDDGVEITETCYDTVDVQIRLTWWGPSAD